MTQEDRRQASKEGRQTLKYSMRIVLSDLGGGAIVLGTPRQVKDNSCDQMTLVRYFFMAINGNDRQKFVA